MLMGGKRNDWLPPAVPALEQEVTQTSAYQYSPWIQPPISTSYYLPGNIPSELPQTRSSRTENSILNHFCSLHEAQITLFT